MLKTSIFAWKNHYCVSSLLFLFFNPVTIATSVNFYLTYILNTDVNVWVRFNINFNDFLKNISVSMVIFLRFWFAHQCFSTIWKFTYVYLIKWRPLHYKHKKYNSLYIPVTELFTLNYGKPSINLTGLLHIIPFIMLIFVSSTKTSQWT